MEYLLDLPLVINGRIYKHSRHNLSAATQILDHEQPGGICSLQVAFSFGDGMGGNVIVRPSALCYLDYDASGYHTSFIDLVKSFYIDGLFNVPYAGLSYSNLTRGYTKEVSLYSSKPSSGTSG